LRVFLWRSELAGHPRNTTAWRGIYDYAGEALSQPGSGLADLHVILAHAVMGDAAALEIRNRQIEELAAVGLLKAYLGSQRLEEAKRLLSARRPSASGVPVVEVGAVQ